MVAVRIMSPGDEQCRGSGLLDALDYPRDRLFRQWAVAGDESVGQAQKNNLAARIESQLGDGLSRFVFPQLPQRALGYVLLAGCEPVPSLTMTTRTGRPSACASAINPPQARLSSSGCGAMTTSPPSPSRSANVANANERAASRASPAFTFLSTDPSKKLRSEAPTRLRWSERGRDPAGEGRSQDRAKCARSDLAASTPAAPRTGGSAPLDRDLPARPQDARD